MPLTVDLGARFTSHHHDPPPPPPPQRYLDNLNIGWQAMYTQDPCGGAPADLCTLILGGHGEMWGEVGGYALTPKS